MFYIKITFIHVKKKKQWFGFLRIGKTGRTTLSVLASQKKWVRKYTHAHFRVGWQAKVARLAHGSPKPTKE